MSGEGESSLRGVEGGEVEGMGPAGGGGGVSMRRAVSQAQMPGHFNAKVEAAVGGDVEGAQWAAGLPPPSGSRKVRRSPAGRG